MNLLTMKGITKAFTDKVLLDDVDFGLEDTDKVGVVGINGTGKSTLLKIAAGLVEPDSGEMAMGNNVKISVLSQSQEFPAGISLYDYVCEGNEEGEAQQILNQFGFDNYHMPVENLSGGQRKKAALARAILVNCDILILDEPTNHLDQEMISWLEDYLKRKRVAIIMVTHDRYFLDRVCNRIVEIDKGNLYSYQTNFSGFLELKAEREEMELATYKKHQNILRKELAWVRRGAQARSTKQKARLQRYEELKNEKAPETDGVVEMSSASSRMGKKTLELNNIRKVYGNRTIIDDFTYIFLRDDRIGIIGPNGCGKSTLMNIVAGYLTPDSGTREVGTTIKLGYFSQENERLDDEMKVIDYIKETAEYARVDGELISASAMLERFLFEGSLQYQKIGKLSGGEKRRLYLLKILMDAPNILLLDEPTNDLDIQTLAILEDYLDDFQGIVVTVSHDRYFLDRIAERIFAFEGNGKISQYEGGFSDYVIASKERRAGMSGVVNGSIIRAGASGNSQKTDGGKTERTAHQQKLKMTFKEQKEFETIEDDIAALEEKLEELDAEIIKCSTNYSRLNELSKEKEDTENLLEEKMERYVYLTDLDEKIKAQ